MFARPFARTVVAAFALASACGFAAPVLADEAAAPAAPAAPAADDSAPPSVADSFPEFADAAAFKKRLKDQGFTLQMTYIGESLANISGGERQGLIYEGRLELMLEADMEKLANWQGATLHADSFWIHGTGIGRYYVGNILPIESYIEALPTVRLYELWLEQKFFDGKLAVRGGLLGADSDFVASKYALLFVNSTTGWPVIFGADMPSGGPAYPLSAMGLRGRYEFNSQLALVAAIYDGDPAGPGNNDPQQRNAHGLNFRLQDRPLLMQEVQYKYNQEKGAGGLPGTVKIGAWENLGNFPNQLYSINGQPFSISGLPATIMSGDYGVYGMVDQLVYATSKDATKGVGVFARAFFSPSDRNQIDFYFDTGLNFSGMTPGRPDDLFGVSFAYGHISNYVRASEFYAGLTPLPSSYSALIEMTYQAQLVPGWTLQPVAQYIVNPGAHLNGTDWRNATVVGVRTTINY